MPAVTNPGALVNRVWVRSERNITQKSVQPPFVFLQGKKELGGVGKVRVPVNGLLVIPLGQGLAILKVVNNPGPVIVSSLGSSLFCFTPLALQLRDFILDTL